MAQENKTGNFFNREFRLAFLLIFLFELLSFLGYLYPTLNKAIFLIIILSTLIVSLYKLEYGLGIVFAELFIGSKGYLFYFENNGFNFPLRIALWLIIISVWAAQLIIKLVREKKLEAAFLGSPYYKYFLFFFIFISWGVIRGLINRNGFNNIFFDFNNWLYFALILPASDIINTKEKFNNILKILSIASAWLVLKTFFILFIFSHYNVTGLVYELYRWIRVTGIGEITKMPNGFTRIFFQSHIFILACFFLSFFLIIKYYLENKEKISVKFLLNSKPFFILLFSNVFLIATILLGFSRSYWAGLAGGLAFSLFIILSGALKKEIKPRQAILVIITLLIFFILSIGIIAAMVKFPYPRPSADFSADFFSDRALNLSEAGAASRWSLLPELWSGIKENIFQGKGFGAVITYITSDPRILESSPKGEYTTYAFEWGWLDIWLKLGFLGLLAYLLLIIKIIFDLVKKTSFVFIDYLPLSLGAGLVTIVIVSIFSPYLNHPLGIGYLILTAIYGHLRK
jgi:O-antigen ligase